MAIENIPVSDSHSRMGRPPLGVKATQVRLPEGTAERIDALVGSGKRAEFIRQAVEKELQRREEEAKGGQP